jgi:hypothetical protein
MARLRPLARVAFAGSVTMARGQALGRVATLGRWDRVLITVELLLSDSPGVPH